METKNNTQKTVNSRVKKMILRGSAVVFSLVLISLTLSAQNFWDQFLTNSSNDNMVLLRTEQNSEFEKVDAAIEAINYELEAKTYISAETFVCETDIDKELAVEAWMTDETYFSTNTSMISEETDEALNLEDWMINNANFNSQFVSIEIDAEPALKVEDWMTDETYFSTNTRMIREETDEALNLED